MATIELETKLPELPLVHGPAIASLGETVRAKREWFAASGRTEVRTRLDVARERELLDRWNAVISS